MSPETAENVRSVFPESVNTSALSLLRTADSSSTVVEKRYVTPLRAAITKVSAQSVIPRACHPCPSTSTLEGSSAAVPGTAARPVAVSGESSAGSHSSGEPSTAEAFAR